MKIQIDTSLKIIKVEESVNFGELVDMLEKLLPNDWKQYKLETGTIIYWTNPIQVIPYQPYQPILPTWQLPATICDSTCNIEIN